MAHDPDHIAARHTTHASRERRRPVEYLDLYALRLACVAAALLHTFFLATFVHQGVDSLAWFNIGSVALFVGCIIYLTKTRRTEQVIAIAALEIVAHQTFAIYVLGWGDGFDYYLIFVPSFTFLGSYRTRTVPLALTAISCACLMWSYFIGQHLAPSHAPLQKWATDMLNVLNMVGIMGLLALIATQYVSTARDNETLLRTARQEAERASSEKSTFLATVSHEFRTPMNAIIGFTSLALRKDDLDRHTARHLERIRLASRNLLGLINDILDFSKIEAGKLETVQESFDLRELVSETTQMFEISMHDEGLELIIEIDEALPKFMRGDPLRVRQVLANLVSNAVKFTHEGHVAVRVVSRDVPEPHVTLSVEDTGVGIDEETMGRLFEPFSQADDTVQRHFGGTGLGLSICKRLVELMGGTLEIASAAGEGSTFSFTLPIDTPPGGHEPPSSAATEVWIIEPRLSTRAELVEVIESFGFTVTGFGDALRAQTFARTHPDAAPDVVVLPLDINGESGVDASFALEREMSGRGRGAAFVILAEQSQGEITLPQRSHVLHGEMNPSRLLDAITVTVGARFIRRDAKSPAPSRRSLRGVRLLVVEMLCANSERRGEEASRVWRAPSLLCRNQSIRALRPDATEETTRRPTAPRRRTSCQRPPSPRPR